MNLQDFSKNSSSSKLNKLLESFNGKKINFSKMTLREASALSRKLDKKITLSSNKMKGNGTKDRALQEAIMIKTTIDRWIFEQHKRLLEDELQQAEVILAAKDLVDRMQDMIESLSKMINEELPPLGDSIRNQIGAEKATAFVGAANDALSSVLDQVRQARTTLDSQTRGLAGEDADMEMSAPAGDEMGAEGGMGGEEEDMGGFDDMAGGSDGFEGTLPAMGGTDKVGRDRR